LLLGELRVSGELGNADVECGETLAESGDLLLDKSLHGRDVDDFEGVAVDIAGGGVSILADGPEDGKCGAVGLELVSEKSQHRIT
jgi:hypothetical protein